MLKVNGTETVSVAHYWDFGGGFDVSHEIVGAAGNDEIDELIQGEQFRDHISSCDKLDGAVWNGCRFKG